MRLHGEYLIGKYTKDTIYHFFEEKLKAQKTVFTEMNVYQEFLNREKAGSTLIDEGVAMPHLESELVIESGVDIFLLEEPVENWEQGAKPVDLIIVLVLKRGENQEILKKIRKIVVFFADEDNIEQIRSVKNKNELEQVFYKSFLEE
jgi:PTS system nitrogen regulatory IIA component